MNGADNTLEDEAEFRQRAEQKLESINDGVKRFDTRKCLDDDTMQEGGVGPNNTYSFKPGEDVIHFERHGSEIADVLGDSSYDLTKYLDDANSVIKNGQFSPELNAFVSVLGGQGSAKGLMVGLDRTTGEITTMHMKPIKFFEAKAPSLGWQAQPKFDLTDLVGPNPNLGWKAPYPFKGD